MKISDIPLGVCGCGCGGATTVPAKSITTQGRFRGVPVRFIHGHVSKTRRRGYVVDPATGCWNYQGHAIDGRYGEITVDGRRVLVHRYYFEQAKGPIPAGYDVDHTCRNTRCVNPDHLEAVTKAVNAQRRRTTKLTTERVVYIRAAAAAGRSMLSLAKELGVANTTIRRVVSGLNWKEDSHAA